jgi:hypothetical protein
MRGMGEWAATFKYALRGLLRQPTFAAVAIVTLALGIGANTAIFSVIKTVVLNPLPYESPEKIAVLWEVNPDGNQGPVSIPTYEDWKRDAKSFESLAAYRHVDFSYKGTGDPQNVPGLKATPELFTVLKSNAQLGRTFAVEEATVGNDRVVVLSDGFWRRMLGGDASVIGRAIQLDSVPYVVVGVMPPVFEFPTARAAPDR